MGVPKQRWTPEEEAALRAGVLKYGRGKWRTILKDPEFGEVLHMRSNVDLKDKWRNMCGLHGLGSKERARMQVSHNLGESSSLPVNVAQSDEYAGEANSCASPRAGRSRKSIIRLGNVIREAIDYLEEREGSNRKAIAAYIEDRYMVHPSFRGILSAKLKYMTSTGELVKMKDNKYRIAQIDSDLANMSNMTREEATAVADRAVAEAAAAIAAAEEAAREAEEAEAEAAAAQAFAEALARTGITKKYLFYDS